MPYGVLDTKHINLPANIDATYLRGLTTRSGVQWEALLRTIDARLAAFNSSLDPLVAALITPTTEAWQEDMNTSAFVAQEENEYTVPRPQLSVRAGHMYAIKGWDISLQFTEDGLEGMTQPQILNVLDNALLGMRAKHRARALYRLFSDAEVRIHHSTTATSPGFAGSGTGSNAFAGSSYPSGEALPSPYTHYYRDEVADRATVIKAARDRLKMWHPGPYDLVASAAEVTAITALTDFVSVGSELIRAGTGVSTAQVDVANYVGVYDNDIRVWKAANEFTTAHIALFKSYGPLNAMNPLVWRYDSVVGRGAYVRSRMLYPLDQATLKQRFDVSVRDRTQAALIYLAASGDYSAPTITGA